MDKIKLTNENIIKKNLRNGKYKKLTKHNPSRYANFLKKFPDKKLKEKQKIFAEEYVMDFNGTRSAIIAGYSEKTAYSISGENLKKPEINAYINYLQENISMNLGISREKIATEYAKIAFSSIEDLHDSWLTLQDYDTLDSDALAAIQSIESIKKKIYNDDGEEEYVDMVRIKLYDKIKGLNGVEKALGYDKPMEVKVDDISHKIKSLSNTELDNRLERLSKERALKIKSE